MAKEAAAKGHKIEGNPTTIHKWTESNSPMSQPCKFKSTINKAVSSNVFINGQEAATVDSIAEEPSPPESTVTMTTAQPPKPKAKATISSGSSTVFINGKGAARKGDPAEACEPGGKVTEGSDNVLFGD